MSGRAFVAVIAFAVLLMVFGGFAFLYYVMALSTGLLDIIHFCVVVVGFAATVKMRPLPGYFVSALLGVMLLFPLSLFLYVSNNGVIRFAGLDGAATIVNNGAFPIWLIGYIGALSAAQMAARRLWGFARPEKKAV